MKKDEICSAAGRDEISSLRSDFSCLSESNQQRQVDPKGPFRERADGGKRAFQPVRPFTKSAAPCGTAPALLLIA
ncbi:MAG: hypothetical protein IKX28_05175 [Bacteroidales bacterium]|nr:hypothetical protein [Bacteroidales bacterium]